MSLRIVCAAVCALALQPASADLLQKIIERGYVKCAVQAGHEGFASPDVYGEWKGFDADFCRAIAAAVLGDGERVMFVSADRSIGIDSLATGSADVVARAATDLSTLGGEGARPWAKAWWGWSTGKCRPPTKTRPWRALWPVTPRFWWPPR